MSRTALAWLATPKYCGALVRSSLPLFWDELSPSKDNWLVVNDCPSKSLHLIVHLEREKQVLDCEKHDIQGSCKSQIIIHNMHPMAGR